MLITVAICTWNRAALLDQTLAEMRTLRIPEGVDWELLVVNNNCTDETDETVAKYSQSLPIRRVYEPEAGLSNARNCAVREARGEYIIWTDDDVLVPPNWISAYVAAFRTYPEAAIFGSDITPWFEGEAPSWLTDNWQNINGAYAAREFGNTSQAITELMLPYGANFAIHAREQRRYSFDPSLGSKETQKTGGDETTVILKMLLDGAQGRWVPDAPVRHYIPRDRQTLAYLRRYYFGQGQGAALATLSCDVPRLLGKPRYAWRIAIACEFRFQFYRLLRNKSRSVPNLAHASRAWGILFPPTQADGTNVCGAQRTHELSENNGPAGDEAPSLGNGGPRTP